MIGNGRSPTRLGARLSSIGIRRISLDFQADCALPQQRLDLVKRVNPQRAGLGDTLLAYHKRIGIAVAADHYLGAVCANAVHLRRRSDAWHEDRCPNAQSLTGIGHSRAMVAA